MSQRVLPAALKDLPSLTLAGQYKTAVQLLAEYAARYPGDAEAALEHIRVLLRMGHVGRAAVVMEGLTLGALSPGVALRLGLEGAWIGLQRTVDLAGAAAEADRLWQESLASEMPESERANALFVRARIIEAAAALREVPLARLDEARADLIAAADGLAGACLFDEELNARLLLARRAAGDDVAALGYISVAERGRAAGRLDYCAEALCREAERRYKLGASLSDVAPFLAEARAANAAIGRQIGLLDVDALEAKIRIDREKAPLSELEAVIEAYRQHDIPARQLIVLADLSAAAHRRGEMEAAIKYRTREDTLAEASGVLLGRISAQLALADILMRHGKYLDSIDVCEAALEIRLPREVLGKFEQVLSACYIFAGDGKRFERHLGNAVSHFEAIDDLQSASLAIELTIVEGLRNRTVDKLTALEKLATDGARQDNTRTDYRGATVKHRLHAQLLLEIYRLPGFLEGDPNLLLKAETAADCAAAAVSQLSGSMHYQQSGELFQLRGQIALARKDEAGCEAAFREAAKLFDTGGFAYEAANCGFTVGLIRLNMAADAACAGKLGAIADHFGEAERHLLAARDYYDAAGMRSAAANAAHKIALLWSNASRVANAELALKLRDAALTQLSEAETMLDDIRSSFAPGGMLDARHGKATVVAESLAIYNLALSIERDRGSEPESLWSWHQKSRARALGDALALHPGASDSLRAAIAGEHDKEALLERETAVRRAITKASGSERQALRQELAQIRAEMSEHEEFAAYLTMRAGRSPDLEAICGLLARQRGRKVVIADWIAAGASLGIMVTTAEGVAPIAWIADGAAQLEEIARNWISFARMRSDLLSTDDHLAPLKPLIAPLAGLTERGDHIVLCPPGTMLRIPLHAIALGKEPLITRNSISYAPSAAVLSIICARRNDTAPSGEYRVFADPTSDRTQSLHIAARIGALLGTEPAVGAQVTREACLDAIRSAQLFHFQGHCRFEGADPLRSRLILAEGSSVAAEDILAMAGDIAARLIVLGACESARLHMAPGDEPMGLPAALLVAGARAVCAPVWPVDAGDAAAFMECFYRHLMAGGGPHEPALALQAAMNEIRTHPSFDRPYSWAPYLLYGDWAN